MTNSSLSLSLSLSHWGELAGVVLCGLVRSLWRSFNKRWVKRLHEQRNSESDYTAAISITSHVWGSVSTNKLINRSEKYESENKLFDDNLIAFQKSGSYLKETEQLGLGSVISVTIHMRKVCYKWIWSLSHVHMYYRMHITISKQPSPKDRFYFSIFILLRLNEWWLNQSRFPLRCESSSRESF